MFILLETSGDGIMSIRHSKNRAKAEKLFKQLAEEYMQAVEEDWELKDSEIEKDSEGWRWMDGEYQLTLTESEEIK